LSCANNGTRLQLLSGINYFLKLFFIKRINMIECYSNGKKSGPTFTIQFLNKPLFVFIKSDANPRNPMLINDHPDQLVIDTNTFKFLCCSVNINNNHFISFFKINNLIYKCDGIIQERFELYPYSNSRSSYYNKKTNYSFYYLLN
jgi:hypothetical protein